MNLKINRWSLVWLFTFTYFLFALASADGAFRLNHQIGIELLKALWGGGKAAIFLQGKTAESLDNFTKERWGDTPQFDPRISDCTEYLNPVENSLQEITEARLSGQKLEPYCTTIEGKQRYLINDGSSFVMESINPHTGATPSRSTSNRGAVRHLSGVGSSKGK